MDSENPFDDISIAWPSSSDDVLSEDKTWWLVACMDWSRDRWIGYVTGYRKGAGVIATHVASTARDQDYLVYPFLMCWRHYVELQLKVLIAFLEQYHRESKTATHTHSLDRLWYVARTLLEKAFPNESRADLDNAERVLMQLHGFDPTSEHFRYPVRRDGTDTMTKLGRVHIGRFHESMDAVANFLDAADSAIRDLIEARDEYERATHDLHGL